MKNKILILGVAMSGLVMSQDVTTISSLTDSTCIGITTKNKNCKIKIKKGNFCHHHAGQDTIKFPTVIIKPTVICGKNTSKNTPCKNKTKDTSGHCHHHRD